MDHGGHREKAAVSGTWLMWPERDRKERRSEYSVTSGTRQLHRICWYPMRAFMELIQTDESRWHRGKCLPVLDSTKGVLSGTFFIWYFTE